MKTLAFNWSNRPLQLAFLILLLIGLYHPSNSFAQKNTKQVSAKNVKPPKEDLHTAVLTGNMNALKQHIAAGGNLNVKEPMGGSSPLVTTTLLGKTDMAKILIDAGANLNLKNNDGSTALHVAAFFCRAEIVKMLLAKHADPAIKNNYGSTAYETVALPFKEVKNVYDMTGKKDA